MKWAQKNPCQGRGEGREEKWQRKLRQNPAYRCSRHRVLLCFSAMWCNAPNRVSRPLFSSSYRCAHETFHQLQACRVAQSSRSRNRTPRGEVEKTAAELLAGPRAVARRVFKNSEDGGTLLRAESIAANRNAARNWHRCHRAD